VCGDGDINKILTLGVCFLFQVQTIVADNKCRELFSLLQSVQTSDVVSRRDIISYRREAELNVGQDDHLYRVEWVSGLNLA
jgi:paired amphipathic helix protein Sin3a